MKANTLTWNIVHGRNSVAGYALGSDTAAAEAGHHVCTFVKQEGERFTSKLRPTHP